MLLCTLRSVSSGALALTSLLALSSLHAGPPLICEPFDAGHGPALPWGDDPGWHAPDRDYDVRRLKEDLLALLTPDAAMLTRMENLRRATIYAAPHPRIAAELLDAVVERTDRRPADALAWFDLAYLLESFEQARWIDVWKPLTTSGPAPSGTDPRIAGSDGYAIMLRALELSGSDPAIEYAASLMATDGAVSAAHHARAVQQAVKDSPLANHLAAKVR
jgi:hypothetical protein